MAAALLTPTIACAGYYGFTYVFRDRICYDRLQRVDETLYANESLPGVAAELGIT